MQNSTKTANNFFASLEKEQGLPATLNKEQCRIRKPMQPAIRKNYKKRQTTKSNDSKNYLFRPKLDVCFLKHT